MTYWGCQWFLQRKVDSRGVTKCRNTKKGQVGACTDLMPLGRVSKLYLRAMKSYIHPVSSRKQMAQSALMIEESLIKELFTKMWAAFKETSKKILVPRSRSGGEPPPWLGPNWQGKRVVTGVPEDGCMETGLCMALPGGHSQPQGNLAGRWPGLSGPDFPPFHPLISCRYFPLVKCHPSDTPGQESV